MVNTPERLAESETGGMALQNKYDLSFFLKEVTEEAEQTSPDSSVQTTKASKCKRMTKWFSEIFTRIDYTQ